MKIKKTKSLIDKKTIEFIDEIMKRDGEFIFEEKTGDKTVFSWRQWEMFKIRYNLKGK